MKKKSMLLIITAIILCSMLVLSVAGGNRFPLINKIVTTVVLPIEEGLNKFLHTGDVVRDFLRALTIIRHENKVLQEENQKLREDNVTLANVLAENSHLQQLLNYKKTHTEQKIIAAKVIARNFGDLRDTVYISAGASDKIQKDMLVVTNAGVAGIVDEVYDAYARVLLITSPNCRIGTKIARIGIKTTGVIHGKHETSNTLLMEHIFRKAEIAIGDVIVTNNFSGKHPENIPVGKVVSFKIDATGLVQEANVKPYVDVDDLEYVMVITDFSYKILFDKEKGRNS